MDKSAYRLLLGEFLIHETRQQAPTILGISAHSTP